MFSSGAAAFFSLWADPGINLGFHFSPCLKGRHLEVICFTKALATQARGMLWAGSRVAWVSARPAGGWKAGRCFRLLTSSVEGAASWAAGRVGRRHRWSLAWHDLESSERLGGLPIFLRLWHDSCIAPSGKNHFSCDSFTSPSCLACLPREGRLWGKGRGALQRPL